MIRPQRTVVSPKLTAMVGSTDKYRDALSKVTRNSEFGFTRVVHVDRDFRRGSTPRSMENLMRPLICIPLTRKFKL
jgi:hypothetical protein